MPVIEGESWSARLFRERDDLRNKMKSLRTFMESKSFDDLHPVERSDLREQLDFMSRYYAVLSRRCTRYSENNV